MRLIGEARIIEDARWVVMRYGRNSSYYKITEKGVFIGPSFFMALDYHQMKDGCQEFEA